MQQESVREYAYAKLRLCKRADPVMLVKDIMEWTRRGLLIYFREKSPDIEKFVDFDLYVIELQKLEDKKANKASSHDSYVAENVEKSDIAQLVGIMNKILGKFDSAEKQSGRILQAIEKQQVCHSRDGAHEPRFPQTQGDTGRGNDNYRNNYRCSYCNLVGHKEIFCYRKKRDLNQ